MSREKVYNFLSSFGIMLAGVFLLLLSPISLLPKQNRVFLMFPQSEKRVKAGGDITLEALPSSRPAAPLAREGAKPPPNFSAASAVVMDANTKAILFEKNIKENKSQTKPL